jgi:hypothetical protein
MSTAIMETGCITLVLAMIPETENLTSHGRPIGMTPKTNIKKPGFKQLYFNGNKTNTWRPTQRKA